ncbi:MAG: hypothetical protein NTU88_10040, partial [Armatimonadetes bacterium]|nr:hypothetical protein [Armatimonadota bacterium]
MVDRTVVSPNSTKASRLAALLIGVGFRATVLLAPALLIGLASVCAAQQPAEEGVCARVRIRISQDVVLTRTVFRATLEVANSEQNVPLEQFKVTLDIRDKDGQVANNLFLVKPPVLTNISDID